MLFFFQSVGDHRALHSFPTRRSSDLTSIAPPLRITLPVPPRVCTPLKLRAPKFMGRLTVPPASVRPERSEEHTSELQSRPQLVCRPLRGKKKRVTKPGARVNRLTPTV